MKRRALIQALLVFLCIGTISSAVAGQEGKRLELNSYLMERTFKINGPPSVVGTVFILGKPKKDPTRSRYVLITAAHVLEKIEGEFATLDMRRKLPDSRWEKLPIQVRIRSHELALWTKHPDADVAVMYISLPAGLLADLLPADEFLVDDEDLLEFEIHPGDELICLGYPFGAESNPAGFPILRSGKIASYPLVPTKETKVFLLDFEVFGGNSGGPVYFAQTGRSYGGATHVTQTIQFIAGLVSTEVQVTEQIQELYGRREQRHSLALAQVVHASLIKEAISLLPPPDEVPE